MVDAVVLQVSDTHFSPRAPEATENWEVVLDHVARVRPDLVVHTGDISLNGADDDDDLRLARAQLDRLDGLGVPWCAIPGNHDLGDGGHETQPVDAHRRRRYEDVFGDRCWSRDLGGWRLIGTDTQTLLADDEAARAEYARLDAEVGGVAPVALFLHRPVVPPTPSEPGVTFRYLHGSSRRRILALIEDLDARLVASGHVHQWRTLVVAGRSHVWAPSTWAMVPDGAQPDLGSKIVGLVEHRLAADGTAVSTLVAPAGLRQLTIGAEFPSPYDH